MPNQQLLDYIKQCQTQGLTDEAIKKALADTGWSQVDIEAGFNSSSQSLVGNNNSLDPAKIIKESWEMLKQRPKNFLLIAVIPSLSGLVVSLFKFGLLDSFGDFGILIAVVLFGFLLFVILGIWGYLASLQIIKDWQENIDVVTAFRRSASKILGASWITILSLVAVFSGFVLLFFPGVWLSVSLSLVIVIYFFEGASGFEALKQSQKLISGKWWSVFWCFIVIGLFFLAFSIIIGIFSGIIKYFLDYQWQIILSEVVSSITFFAYYSFMSICYYKIYQSLRLAKPKA